MHFAFSMKEIKCIPKQIHHDDSNITKKGGELIHRGRGRGLNCRCVIATIDAIIPIPEMHVKPVENSNTHWLKQEYVLDY